MAGPGVWVGSEHGAELVRGRRATECLCRSFLVNLESQQVQLDGVYASLAHLLESDSESVEFKQGSSWVRTAMVLLYRVPPWPQAGAKV